MPIDKPITSGFTQKALVVIFAAVMVAIVGGLGSFFYWLAGSTMALLDTTTRIEGQVMRIEQQVNSLTNTRTDQAEEQASSNTRRLDDLEQDSSR